MPGTPGVRDLLECVARGDALPAAAAEEAMGWLLRGEMTAAQIGAFLAALRVRGETEEEILGFARSLRRHGTPMPPLPRPLLDTCGTGGDGQHTWNVSTAAAMVAAAQGARVVKHGNRSVGSRCGSADVLEALGMRIELAPDEVPAWIARARFAFLFAPRFHPAMRHAAAVRRELGFRTVMNLLGPLANPAATERQLLGLSAPQWLQPIARILHALGTERALVVHGRDGMDEISPSQVTDAVWLDAGQTRQLQIVPEDFCQRRWPAGSLRGGTAEENARALERTFSGEEGALADAVALNGGAALWVWGAADDLAHGCALARETLASGRVKALLGGLRSLSRPGEP